MTRRSLLIALLSALVGTALAQKQAAPQAADQRFSGGGERKAAAAPDGYR